MSEQELLFSFLIGLIIASVGTMVLAVLQWRRVNQEALIASRMRKIRGKNQPSVTVLVYAYNQQATLERTLRAIKNSRYHAFDVVVVDDVSTDDTRVTVQAFMKKYPSFKLQLLRRQKRTSVIKALQAGYRKSERGSIVVPIMADQVIDNRYIKRAVAARSESGTWNVSTYERLGSQLDILDIGIFLRKYFWQSGQKAHVHDATYFMRRKVNKNHFNVSPLVHEVVGVVVLAALLLAAFTALGMHALWYAWVVVTAYGLATIWLRYGEPLRDRIVLTLSVPLALFLIPVTSAMRGISQLASRK